MMTNKRIDSKEIEKGRNMSIRALQSVWDGILAHDLSADNKRWLAERLYEQAEKESAAAERPYTMAEIDAMLDEAEEGFAKGQFKTNEEVFHPESKSLTITPLVARLKTGHSWNVPEDELDKSRYALRL